VDINTYKSLSYQKTKNQNMEIYLEAIYRKGMWFCPVCGKRLGEADLEFETCRFCGASVRKPFRIKI